MTRTIWALFSVEVNYHDQPDNNLVAWWFEQPGIVTLAAAMGVSLEAKNLDESAVVAVVNVWNCTGEVRHNDTLWRVVELQPGTVPPRL